MRWRLGRLMSALLLSQPACARGWFGPIGNAHDARPGCPAGVSAETCFVAGGGLLTTPLIGEAGRILVVMEDYARLPAPGFPFVIEEITLAGRADVARGYCPRDTRPGALAQLAAGDVVIVCSGVQSVAALGVVDRAHHSVDWRWHIPVEGLVQESDARVVELGRTIGIVYPVAVYPFPSPHGWELSLADGSARRLDSDLELFEERKLIALVSVGEDLRVLFAGRDDNAEVTLGPNGATKMVRTEQQLGSFTAGTPSRGCVARGADGTVTVSLPTWRAGPDTGDGSGGVRTGTL